MRILKWAVPLDDQWHEIGTGQVAMVAGIKGGFNPVAGVWTIEPDEGVPAPIPARTRRARVYGTGHTWPDHLTHLGSYTETGELFGQVFVWHVLSEEILG